MGGFALGSGSGGILPETPLPELEISLMYVPDKPALIAATVAVELHDIRIVRVASTLHIEAFSAVRVCPAFHHIQAFSAIHVHDLKVVARSTGHPSLIRATVPRELLHVCSIAAASSGHIHHQVTIPVSDGILPVAQLDELPTLIAPAIA